MYASSWSNCHCSITFMGQLASQSTWDVWKRIKEKNCYCWLKRELYFWSSSSSVQNVLALLHDRSAPSAVGPEWDIFKALANKFSYKSSQNFKHILGYFKKHYLLRKWNLRRLLFSLNWLQILATFYSYIWSHWSVPCNPKRTTTTNRCHRWRRPNQTSSSSSSTNKSQKQ